MASHPPTIRELAAQLNLSTATVSLGLRRHPSVKPDTRDRILSAAAKSGYQPNALVNALMTQVRNGHILRPTGEVVCYLTSDKDENSWKQAPSHALQFEGAKKRAEELGFRLEPLWIGFRGNRSRRASGILRARGVRGSILAPLTPDHETLELDWNEHTIIAIGYSFKQIALNRVVTHQINGMFACYSNLRILGYQRIGLAILKHDDERVHHSWLAGFLGSQAIFGGRKLAPLVESTDDPDALFRWFEKQRPDVVIGIWPHFSLDRLMRHGIRVPHDIGYASLDIGKGAVGQIAGILQDDYTVGMTAMDVLATQLFHNEIGIPAVPKITLIEGAWKNGQTIRCVKQCGRKLEMDGD